MRRFLGEVELRHFLVGGHRHGARPVDREHDGEARDLDLLLTSIVTGSASSIGVR